MPLVDLTISYFRISSNGHTSFGVGKKVRESSLSEEKPDKRMALRTPIFLISILLLLSVISCGRHLLESGNELRDQEIFKGKVEFSLNMKLGQKGIGEIITHIGESFVGSRYLPYTLETSGEEHLIVNLREFDCVTFVESTLALAKVMRCGNPTFSEFKRELRLVRYRNGVIGRYPSRLHYFTDWVLDNQKKGNVQNITADIGGVSFKKSLNYMSMHRKEYPALANEAFFEAIRKREIEVSQHVLCYIPQRKIDEVEEKIRSGDIIGITTSVDGLDISHVGFAYQRGGTLYFLHASARQGKVKISDVKLAEYVAGEEGSNGIMVVRPIDVKE